MRGALSINPSGREKETEWAVGEVEAVSPYHRKLWYRNGSLNGPELRKEVWPFYHFLDQPLDVGCARAVGMALGEYRARLWREA